MLLTKEQIEALPSGIYATRGCDYCGAVILNSYCYKKGDKDFETKKCMVLFEEQEDESNKKGKKKKMGKDKESKKSKKDRDDEDDDDDDDRDEDKDRDDDDDDDDDKKKKKKKRSRDDDDDEDEDDDKDDDDEDRKDKKKKMKDKKKDKKDKKKDKKDSKDKDSKKSKGAGNYRAGSNSAIMYERLADQKRHTFKDLFKKIDSPLPTLRRLERHAKKFKKFKLDVDRDNETVRMKKL